MRLRIVIVALVLLGVTGPLCAEPPKPNAVLQIKPIDEWLSDLKYLMKELGPLGEKLAGDAGLAKPADKLDIDKRFDEELAKVLGPDWRNIIDSTRPLGGYAIVKEKLEEGTYVGMLPVKDVKALLKSLANFGITPEEKDGLFTIQLPNKGMTTIYARAANGYVYVGSSASAVAESNLPKPEDIFGAKETSSLVLRFRIDSIPEEDKKKVIAELQKGIEQGLPNESEAFNEFVKSFGDSILKVWRDGREWTLGLDFDRKSGELALVTEIIPTPGTELAKEYQDAKPNVSRLAALAKGAAAYGGLTCGIPMSMMFDKDTGKSAQLQKSLAEAGIKIDNATTEKLLKMLAAAAPTDDTDAAVAIYGEEGKGSTLVALHIKEGAKAEAALAEFVKDLPADLRERVKMNAGKIGSANVHRFDPDKDTSEKLRKDFGASEVIAVVTQDVVYVAFGADTEARIKAALSAKPQPAPIFAMDISVALLRKEQEKKAKDEKERAEMKKAFAALGKDEDTLRLMQLTRTSGQTMKYRLAVPLVALIKIGYYVSPSSSTKPPAKSIPKAPPAKPSDRPKEEKGVGAAL